MSFKILIEPRALADVQDAITYYDGKQTGLGEKFYNAFNNHLDAIAKNPFYQLRYKDYRTVPINKFPYIIFFYIDEEIQTAYVTAVFHTSQNPIKYPE
jgi:plasmid stabilization system protein ParE